MKFSHTVLTVVTVGAMALGSVEAAAGKTRVAKRAPKETVQKEAPSKETGFEPKPIDELQTRLMATAKSKDASKIIKAYGLARKGKSGEALKLLAPLKESFAYWDYALWTTAIAHQEKARTALKAKKLAEARKSAERAAALLAQVEVKDPYSPLLKVLPREFAATELVQAQALYDLGKKPEALAVFERAFQRLNAMSLLSLLRPDALSRYSEGCKTPSTPICLNWARRFVSVFSRNSPELKAVTKYLPESSLRIKAIRIDRLSRSYKGADQDQLAFDAAMALWLAEKNSEAIPAFRKFLDEFPRSGLRFRVRYWLGQALLQQREVEAAGREFSEVEARSPLTYYAMLSAMTNGHDLKLYLSATLPDASARDQALGPLELHRLKRAESLLAERGIELAALELRDLRHRDALSSPFLLYLAHLQNLAGNHVNAFAIMGELIQRQYEGIYSSFALRLIFPSPYFDLIQKHAREQKLDPILVLSLIKQESSFDVHAVSSAGAQGLMQLMPATALDTDSEVLRAELVEAEHNIRVGTKYLRQLLTHYNGNIALAVAAYNAGPGAVDRWLRGFRDANGKRGLVEFIETIPYRETRDYVAAILRNYFWYSQRLTEEGATATVRPLTYFWEPAKATPLPADPSYGPEPAPAGEGQGQQE